MTNNRTIRFLAGLMRNPMQIGAIAPSSEALALAIVGELDLSPGDLILELGPGTGSFTRQIARVLPDGGAYLGIERDASFVRFLRIEFPRLRFVNGSAEDLDELQNRTGGPPRVIISGLPFATLGSEVSDNIIEALDRLMTPGSVFRTMQYIHAWPMPSATRFRRRMTSHFGDYHRSKAILYNLPPAFVLTWRR